MCEVAINRFTCNQRSGALHTRDWEPVANYTSSTLIGGKCWAGPSSLHTTLEGPMEYANARWMWRLSWFLHGIKWIMFHGHLDCFHKPLLGGMPNTKPEDHGIPNAHNRWFILLFYHVRGPAWIKSIEFAFGRGRSHIRLHTTLEDPWPHYMILEMCWDGGLRTLSSGLSQFHGHGSWLVCEVALLGSHCIRCPSGQINE